MHCIDHGMARVHEWTKCPIVGVVPCALIATAGVVMMISGAAFGFLLALPGALDQGCSDMLNKSFEMIPKGFYWTSTGVIEVVGNLFGTISQWMHFCQGQLNIF